LLISLVMKTASLLLISAILSITSSASAKKVDQALRDSIFKKAKVWSQPAVPVSQADLSVTPVEEDGFSPNQKIECSFVNKKSSGQTAKFYCKFENGDEIKVKPSIPFSENKTETAATRLLSALGFGADRMYLVDELVCYGGCPKLAYPTHWWFAMHFTRGSGENTFKHAAIERKFKATDVETETREGWWISELAMVDPILGGSTKAETDALRLMSLFLTHWDNKSENQRLVCLDETFKENPTDCKNPFLLLHDVGATWGKRKSKNLKKWSQFKIWADEKTCKVSMKGLPFDGASFDDTTISEDGRLFLANLLKQLSRQQITDLFTGAHFESSPKKIAKWVDAFEDKVKQIADRAPCPQ
jgi:hypothetical protein